MAGDDVIIRVRVANDARAGLDSARRDARSAGQDAGRGFADGASREASRAEAGFRQAGQNAGRGFSGQLSGSLKDAGDAASSAASGLAKMGAGAAILSWAPGAASALLQLAGAAAALPGILGAAAGIAGTFAAALSGIGDAFSALDQKGGGGGGGGAGNAAAATARQIRDATAAVNDAREQQRRTARDTERDIVAAEKAVADAAKEGARQVADAKRAQARAAEESQRQVTDAYAREQDALNALDRARKESAQQLDDLRDRVDGYGRAEEDATTRLLQAQAAQRKTNRDATSTTLERRAAADAVADAEAALAKTQKDGAKDAADLAEAEAKGVDGSDQMVAARNNVADAERGVADAKQSAAERTEDAARAVADAETESAARVAAARENLAETEESAAERRSDAQKSVNDALQRLADVQADAGASAGAAAGGTDAWAKAMAKLSPNAREFMETIRELKPAWDDMIKSVQDKAFEGFAEETRELAGVYLPVLHDGLGGIAESLNAMALHAADALMDPRNVDAVNQVLGNTASALDTAQYSLADLLTGFLQMAGVGSEYLEPMAEEVAQLAAEFAEWASSAEGQNEIRQWIDDAVTAFGQLWDIAQNVWTTLSGLFSGLGDDASGGDFLATIVAMTQSLSDFVASDGVQGILGFLGMLAQGIADNLPLVLGIAAAFGALNLVVSLASGILGIWNGLQMAAKVASMVWTGAQWLLNAALSANPIGIMIVVIGALVAALVWAYNSSSTFRAIVSASLSAVGAAFSWLLGVGRGAINDLVGAWNGFWGFIGGIASRIGGALSGMWAGIAGAARGALNGVIGILNGLVRGVNVLIGGFNSISPIGIPYVPGIPYLARGGIASGLAVVGEQGPELVRLPSGSTVVPNGQTNRELAAAGGSASVGGVLEVRITGSGELAELLHGMQRAGQLEFVRS